MAFKEAEVIRARVAGEKVHLTVSKTPLGPEIVVRKDGDLESVVVSTHTMTKAAAERFVDELTEAAKFEVVDIAIRDGYVLHMDPTEATVLAIGLKSSIRD